MDDGDVFTFDINANIDGNVSVKGRGDGEIIIEPGVTVNVDGNFQLDDQNSKCTLSQPCVFKIVVHGTLHISGNFKNNLYTVVWSGTGTVVFDDDLENSSNGCMSCGGGGCPNFTGNPDCSDNGVNCPNGDFCDAIANPIPNPCAPDIEAPNLVCPSNIVTNIIAGCTRAVSWTPPVPTDNCSPPPPTATTPFPPGTLFSKGVHTIVYTAVDASGNSKNCSFTVTVNDLIKPIITNCPTNIVTNLTGPGCTRAVSWTPPAATDNCTLSTFSPNFLPGSSFPKGVTTVIYTARDASDNIETCSFTVTVNDLIKPIITNCPTNIVTNISGSGCTRAVSWTSPAATDNCASVAFTPNFLPGSSFPKGITTVIYTATDASGNIETCSFTVTVNDNIAPLINCPPEVTITSYDPILQTGIATWKVPEATDNCSTISSLIGTADPGDSFPKGMTLITYTATDASGNITTCDFEVNMTEVPEEIELEVYKALSPNNDGFNDVWRIKGIENYPKNRVTVFDRWGREVYSVNGYNNENVMWDGLNGGKTLPTGTYFYVIEINNGASVLRGPLELVH